MDNLANEDNFGKFDHLIRSLGRDGLLEPGVKEELVQGGWKRNRLLTHQRHAPEQLLTRLRNTCPHR